MKKNLITLNEIIMKYVQVLCGRIFFMFCLCVTDTELSFFLV